MNRAPPAATPTAAPATRVRVMVVDDAIVVRGLFSRWIEAEADLELVASLRTGREAVLHIERADPDVVVLDVDMPELDGLSALPQILAKRPGVVVIMASTLTRRSAEISLRALSLGATDYLTKPSNGRHGTASDGFHRELIEKIRHLARRSRRNDATLPHVVAPSLAPRASVAPHAADIAQGPLELRPMPLFPPAVLLIGASTGGPQALDLVLGQIGPVIDRVPVLITQHMPPTFTAILAEHLTRLTQYHAHEGSHGEAIKPGSIYIAPGGRHMTVAQRNGAPVIEISDGAPVNFCKPAVDPLFASAAAVYGTGALALVLTGMGQDGLSGAREIVAAGGHVIAQDEASSVVWGMPGQVALDGLCSAVLPIDQIGGRLLRLFAGERV